MKHYLLFLSCAIVPLSLLSGKDNKNSIKSLTKSLKKSSIKDIDAPQGKYERTSLMEGALKDDVEEVEALLEKGADPEKKSSSGQTALMYAAGKGNCDVIRSLLLWGNKARLLTIQDKMHRTAFDIAREKNQDEAADLLERLLRTIAAKSSFPRAYFSPNINQYLVKFIADEQVGIQSAMFRLTHGDIGRALVKQKTQKEITIDVVVDKDFSTDFTQMIELMIKNDIDVSINTQRHRSSASYEHVHHKFFIFQSNIKNKKLLWTGSFNCTGQAEKNNWENVVVIDDEDVIDQYEQEFGLLKKHSISIPLKDAKNTKSASDFVLRMNALK